MPESWGGSAVDVKCVVFVRRRAIAALHSQASQTVTSSTPASSSPQARCSVKKPSRSASRVIDHGSRRGGDPLLYELIRPRQQRGRDREAEGLGGLAVDDQLEPRH